MPLLSRLAPVLFLFMWSSGAIFVKLGLESASVWSFLALRAGGALLLILLIGSIFFPRPFYRLLLIPKKLILRSLLLGLLLQVAYQSFFFLSIDHHLAPGMLALILGLQPLVTPLFARERIGRREYGVLALGFCGLALAVYGAKDTTTLTVTGVVFGLLAMLAMSTGTAYQKRLAIHPLASAVYQYGASASYFFILVSIQGWQVQLNPPFLLALGWMICMVSVGAVLLLLYMLTKETASKVAVLFYLVPIFTIIFDYCVFGTKITLLTMIGALLVLISIRFYRALPMAQTASRSKNF